MLSKDIDAGRAHAPVQGDETSTLVVRVRREEVHRVGTPSLIQRLKPTPGERPVLRDEHLGDLIREGVLLTGNPFLRNCDSVAQTKPENLSCQIVNLGASSSHDSRSPQKCVHPHAAPQTSLHTYAPKNVSKCTLPKAP